MPSPASYRKPDRGGKQSIPQAGLRRENDKHDIDDNYDKCLPLDGGGISKCDKCDKCDKCLL